MRWYQFFAVAIMFSIMIINGCSCNDDQPPSENKEAPLTTQEVSSTPEAQEQNSEPTPSASDATPSPTPTSSENPSSAPTPAPVAATYDLTTNQDKQTIEVENGGTVTIDFKVNSDVQLICMAFEPVPAKGESNKIETAMNCRKVTGGAFHFEKVATESQLISVETFRTQISPQDFETRMPIKIIVK